MDSHRLIDAQFDRAVEIVQSLPKAGPIQTGYEEKLALYSLYKQATTGNVKQSRPGMWDMLGRAKWDAWAKQKDLSPPEAKWLYVETLQKILRKYPGAAIALELSKELASYGGDPANLVMSGSINPSGQDDASSSDDGSEDDLPAQYMPPYPRDTQQQTLAAARQPLGPPPETSSDDGGEESADELPTFHQNTTGGSIARPLSGVSRYRTPMGMSSGVPATYTPPVGGFNSHPLHNQPLAPQHPHTHQPQIPATQPLPRYATPSAFSPSAEDSRNLSSASPSIPSSFPTTSLSYPAHLSHSQLQPYAFRGAPINPPQQPAAISTETPHSSGPMSRSQSGVQIEQAVESVQASVAALRERLEGLESHAFGSNPSLLPRGSLGATSPGGLAGSGGTPSGNPELHWDPSQMGLWSTVLVPATHIVNQVKYVLILLLSNPPPSNGRAGRNGRRSSGGLDIRSIVRRLVLDASFVFTLYAVLRAAWRASGIRRREVLRALRLVWIALMGTPPPRRMLVDRGV